MEEDLVLWDARAESILLDNIENFPPIGINKYFNMLSISIRLTKNCGKEFTTEDVQKRLALFFKLEDNEIIDDSLPLEQEDFAVPSFIKQKKIDKLLSKSNS